PNPPGMHLFLSAHTHSVQDSGRPLRDDYYILPHKPHTVSAVYYQYDATTSLRSTPRAGRALTACERVSCSVAWAADAWHAARHVRDHCRALGRMWRALRSGWARLSPHRSFQQQLVGARLRHDGRCDCRVPLAPRGSRPAALRDRASGTARATAPS